MGHAPTDPAPTDEPTSRPPLRLWPGVVLATLVVLCRFVVPAFVPETLMIGVLGGLAGGLAIAVWWAFFSRAPRWERWGGVALMAVTLVATRYVLHESVATGMMGMMFFIYAVPLLSVAFVVWAVVTRGLPDGARRATMAATVVLACGAWALVRTGGITGDADSDFHWRWSPTAEERLLAQAGDEPAAPAVPAPSPAPPEAVEPETVEAAGTEPDAAEPVPETPAPETPAPETPAPETPAPDTPAPTPAAPASEPEWPGFRGPARDGVVAGVRIATDWAASPPVELWRRPVGPGWSSFAVDGGRVYTQEQRGDDELVSCYDATTGEPVWRHRDAARFWESNAGAGPRGTPTLAGGRVYTLGATGIVNALDAETGAVRWSRNAAEDTGTKTPMWGFSGSPLVTDGLVVVAAAGALVAYDAATGELRWRGPSDRGGAGAGYVSPHRTTIGGVEQILLPNGAGLMSVAPADGALLWEHAWSGYPIVQPAVTAAGDVLLSVSDRSGLRRLAVARGPDGWQAEERWTSIRLKPYFNDFVIHGGHAYGFDGSILACVDLEDGERCWKGGRYGHGQLVLLPEQDLLLVLSEKGALALVGATPDGFTELARFPAIEGKTWNHPVLAGDLLLVRNAQEMAAFRLARARG